MANKHQLTFDQLRHNARAEKKAEEGASLIQLIIFKLGDEEYALNIDQIKEVVTTHGITKLPRSHEYIMGVSNIRGNVIVIVDLERMFNTDQKISNVSNYTLVIENQDYKIGILVNEVPNSLTVSLNDIDTSSTVLQYSNLNQDCIMGIVTSKERMITLLDLNKMMEAEGLRKIVDLTAD